MKFHSRLNKIPQREDASSPNPLYQDGALLRLHSPTLSLLPSNERDEEKAASRVGSVWGEEGEIGTVGYSLLGLFDSFLSVQNIINKKAFLVRIIW